MVQCKTILLIIGLVCLLLLGIPIRIDSPVDSENDTVILFNTYMEQFNKSYRENSTIRLLKYQTFHKTLKEIENLNSQRKNKLSAKFGVTKFSDLSQEEFKEKYLISDLYLRIKNNTQFKVNNERKKADGSSEENRETKYNYNSYLVKRSVLNLPGKVDWRVKNVITKVNNQKNCGACWAFSTVETIESMNAIKNGKLDQLSVQEFIDCARYSNDGCNGGDICTLLYWMLDNDISVQKETAYPLHLRTEVCKLNNGNNSRLNEVKVIDFSCNSLINREDAILYSLANHGPVAVAINAMLWQNYLGGIIQYHCDGSPALLNHAVQIVGYDTTGDIPYYIVRNSWGMDFGDHGYLYLAIGSNVCGLANEVVSLDVF